MNRSYNLSVQDDFKRRTLFDFNQVKNERKELKQTSRSTLTKMPNKKHCHTNETSPRSMLEDISPETTVTSKNNPFKKELDTSASKNKLL